MIQVQFGLGKVAFIERWSYYRVISGSRLHCPVSYSTHNIASITGTSADDCGELDDIENGQISYHFDHTCRNAIANYTCDDGYFLCGPSTRTCLRGGRWSYETPKCRRKST